MHVSGDVSLEGPTTSYKYDGVVVTFTWPDEELLYYNFDPEFENTTVLDYTASDARALFRTEGLTIDDIVETVGDDWVLDYNVSEGSFAYTWTHSPSEDRVQQIRASIEDEGNVDHFLYSDGPESFSGVVN